MLQNCSWLLLACSSNWLVSSDSSGADIFHTDLHCSTFLLSKVKNWWLIWWLKLRTLYCEDEEMLMTFKLIWKADKFRIFGLMILTRSLSRSNLGHFLEPRHLDFFLDPNIPTSLTWLPRKKVWNNKCYVALISTLWNFLCPSKGEESTRLTWIKQNITGNISSDSGSLYKTDPPNIKLTSINLCLFRKFICLSCIGYK